MSKQNKMHLRVYMLLGVVFFIILLSLIAPLIVPNDPYQTELSLSKQPPSQQFPFGTDNFGRCIFSRVLIGARLSILTALFLVISTFSFGTLYGVICGYYGGKVDRVLMYGVDILLAFPDMVLAIAVSGLLGGGLVNVVLALALTGWTPYARLARGQIMSIKTDVFIQAAKISGNKPSRVMFKHMLPNIIGPLVVTGTLQIGTMMMGIAGLSFLGIGIKIPEAEWGAMINEGRSLMQSAPWVVMYPAFCMILFVMVFNLLGDGLRDLLDPKNKMTILRRKG